MHMHMHIHMHTQVSLERLETFLLGDETKRSEAYTADAASSSGEYDENISPKIVLKDAAFGPVAGAYHVRLV